MKKDKPAREVNAGAQGRVAAQKPVFILVILSSWQSRFRQKKAVA